MRPAPPSAALGTGLRRYDGLKRSCPVFAAVPVARGRRRCQCEGETPGPAAGRSGDTTGWGAVPLQRPQTRTAATHRYRRPRAPSVRHSGAGRNPETHAPHSATRRARPSSHRTRVRRAAMGRCERSMRPAPPSAALGTGLRRYDGLKRSCPVFAAVPVARGRRRCQCEGETPGPAAGRSGDTTGWGAVPLQRPQTRTAATHRYRRPRAPSVRHSGAGRNPETHAPHSATRRARPSSHRTRVRRAAMQSGRPNVVGR